VSARAGLIRLRHGNDTGAGSKPLWSPVALMTGIAEGTRDFFVSFNQADRSWATWIAWGLEEAGYTVFFQDWDFKGNFVLEMDKAHQQSRRTIAVLSPDYLASRFTAPEWAARFAQDAMSQHDLLIPVRVRPCELEGLLAQIIYVDLVGGDETAAKKRLLDRVSGLRAKPDEPPSYPRTGGLRAVPERPEYPGVARTAGRWLHQVLMGGGIAAAVTGALLTWWLSNPPSIRAECGVAAGGNITIGRDLRTECPPATPGRD
jgi:hypothetical protein